MSEPAHIEGRVAQAAREAIVVLLADPDCPEGLDASSSQVRAWARAEAMAQLAREWLSQVPLPLRTVTMPTGLSPVQLYFTAAQKAAGLRQGLIAQGGADE